MEWLTRNYHILNNSHFLARSEQSIQKTENVWKAWNSANVKTLQSTGSIVYVVQSTNGTFAPLWMAVEELSDRPRLQASVQGSSTCQLYRRISTTDRKCRCY